MSKNPDDRRLELLQGTLDMLVLRTLQWGPQHGHGIGQTIRKGVGVSLLSFPSAELRKLSALVAEGIEFPSAPSKGVTSEWSR